MGVPPARLPPCQSACSEMPPLSGRTGKVLLRGVFPLNISSFDHGTWEYKRWEGRSVSAVESLTGIFLRSMLFSASTDKTVAVWDSETGERVKRLKGHTSFVNSCYPARRGPQLVCTGSDDGTVKVSVLCKEIVWNESKMGPLKEILRSSHLSGLNSAFHYS